MYSCNIWLHFCSIDFNTSFHLIIGNFSFKFCFCDEIISSYLICVYLVLIYYHYLNEYTMVVLKSLLGLPYEPFERWFISCHILVYGSKFHVSLHNLYVFIYSYWQCTFKLQWTTTFYMDPCPSVCVLVFVALMSWRYYCLVSFPLHCEFSPSLLRV